MEKPFGRHGEWPHEATMLAFNRFRVAVEETLRRSEGQPIPSGERRALSELHRVAERSLSAIPRRERVDAQRELDRLIRRIRSAS